MPKTPNNSFNLTTKGETMPEIYRGKRIDEMSRLELVEALKEVLGLYAEHLGEMRKALNMEDDE